MQGFHLAAYSQVAAIATDQDIAAIPDGILTVQNNHFILRNPMQLLAAAAIGATITRAKIVSPTLRQTVNPYIRPTVAALLPPSNPNVWQLDFSPFQLAAYEEIAVQTTDTAAVRETVLLWLQDQPNPQPAGNVFPCRWTSTTAVVANAWSAVAAVFEQTLPPGVYNMFASEHFSANGIAHAWSIPNQVYRPGFFSFAANTSRLPRQWERGGMGSMGQFRSNALPIPLILANAADAVHEGYLWVQRIGSL